MKTPATADEWYADRASWREEVGLLRAIVLGAGLDEAIKWKHPCYMDRGRNIVIIGVRKEHAVASLLRGALVGDPRGRLVQPGQDRSVRYMPFTSSDQIRAEQQYLEALLAEAVQLAREDRRVPPLPDEIDYVEELRQALAADAGLRAAFEALTPGRRRGYNLHFSKPARAHTREARIARCTERILAGKGLRDCVCGRSKRPPGCDGSHKLP